MVLFILAVIWAAVLLPPYLQSRSESRPGDSISSFQNQLSVLERRTTTVNPALRPRVQGGPARRPVPQRAAVASSHYSVAASSARLTRAAARKRRREVLYTLMGAAGITLLSAVALGGPVWALNLLCDLALGAYVMLLIQTEQRAAERQTKVRYLPAQRQRPPEPALLLRRSGS